MTIDLKEFKRLTGRLYESDGATTAQGLKKAVQAAEDAFKGWKVPASTSDLNKLEAVKVKSTVRGDRGSVFVVAGPKNYESLDMFMDIVVVPHRKPPELSAHVARLNIFSGGVYHGTHWNMSLEKGPSEMKDIVKRVRSEVDALFVKYAKNKGRQGWSQ